MRLIKIYVIIGVTLLISTIIYLIYQNKMYGYSLDLEMHKKFQWIFKDSFLRDIDPHSGSWVGNRNTLNNFVYKRDLKHETAGAMIDFWEFENIGNIDIKQVKFEKSFYYNEIPTNERIVLFSGSRLERITKLNVQFKSKLKIKTDFSDTIIQTFNTDNYVGIYGDFHYVDVYNENGMQIKFMNDLDSQRTLFLVYQKQNYFYFIVVSSNKTIDKEMINNFNLN